MANKVIVNGLNIGYLPPSSSEEILYTRGGGLSVKDKIDEITDDIDEINGKTADDIEYGGGLSVKDKIDNLNSAIENIQATLGFNYSNLFTMKEILSGSNINTVDLKINYKLNNATYSGFLITRHSTYILHGACNNDASAIYWTLKQLDDAGSSEVVTITQDTTDQFKFIIKSNSQWNARFLVLLHGAWIPNLTHEQRQNLFVLNNPRFT